MDASLLNLMNAYEALGLPLDCPFSDVTKVYRRLAKRFHPDSNPEDVASSQEMMTRINAAYSTIRECHENGVSIAGARVVASGFGPAGREHPGRETGRPPGPDHTLWAWIERYENEKRKEEEKRKNEKERLAKEQDASRRLWEKVTLERKQELKDEKTYDVIVKYTRKLISFYYRMNFQNPSFRSRPYVAEDFVGYVDIYRQRLKRISALKRSSKSLLFRRISSHAYEFLKSFMNDSLKPFAAGAERRASALDSFQKAVRCSDKFVRAFFSDDEMDERKVLDCFKKALDHFDGFLKNYPDSPLVEHAYRKVDLLDKLYRGFLKQT